MMDKGNSGEARVSKSLLHRTCPVALLPFLPAVTSAIVQREPMTGEGEDLGTQGRH